MKKIFPILIILFPFFSYSQKETKLEKMELNGINYGKSLIIQNPFSPDGIGYSIQQIELNGFIPTVVEINGSVFELNLTENYVKLNDSIKVTIIYKVGSKPMIYNPEVLSNSLLESLPSLDKNAQGTSYYLKDKSLFIIKGKILDEKYKKDKIQFGIELNKSNQTTISYCVINLKGEYLVIAKADDAYELKIEDVATGKIVKNVLIDLRGIPDDKKRGQMIYVNFFIPTIKDHRIEKLNSEFPDQKLFFNSATQTLDWDKDYSKAINTATEFLTKQITQENSLKQVEIEGKLKQLEIEKNKSDLLSKGLEINNQKNEIEKQTLDKKIKEKEIKEKSLLINQEQEQKKYLYAIITIVFLITLGAIYAFFRQRKLRKLVDAQKTEVENQKHLVEEKHREITDSINYAERIQRSFLATKEQLDNNLSDYFILFKPKDVVSGDFYWSHTLQNGNFALVTADSTGHGVPGAIMSLLNTSSIERAVELGISEPAEILNHTRQTIIERLKKDGSAEGGKDGMDCSLISFNKEKSKFAYAAANNPIWIIRNKELIELAPDKIPVGKHDRDSVSFTQHEVEIQKGDMIYTLTDGFPDQFGGPKGKKFMYKKLKEMLITIAHKPTAEQQTVLKGTLKDWMGNTEQVDDVTIIGVRV